MARDIDDEDVNNNEDAVIVALEKKLKISRWLLYGTGGFSLVIVAILITGLIVINQRLSQLQAPLPEDLEQKFAELDQQIEDVSNFRRIELRRIDVFSDQLSALRGECNVEKTAPLNDLLVQREDDFQALAYLMISGTESLAGMVRGSRKWVDQHRESIERLIENSKARAQSIKAG